MKSIKEIAEEICPPPTSEDYRGEKTTNRSNLNWLQEVTRIEKILEPWKKQIESKAA